MEGTHPHTQKKMEKRKQATCKVLHRLFLDVTSSAGVFGLNLQISYPLAYLINLFARGYGVCKLTFTKGLFNVTLGGKVGSVGYVTGAITSMAFYSGNTSSLAAGSAQKYAKREGERE